VPLLPAEREASLSIPTTDGVIPMARIGCVRLPPPLDTVIDVWWLRQYAGGLFLPLRDGTAGRSSYGGGRYALDSAKGADLGGRDERLIIDLNFLYHPSCRYNDAWQCPLAPPGNTIRASVSVGERLLARYPDRRRVIIRPQRLDKQVVDRHPRRPAPIRIAAEQIEGRFAWLVVDGRLERANAEREGLVSVPPRWLGNRRPTRSRARQASA
jgi:hypothetical protein